MSRFGHRLMYQHLFVAFAFIFAFALAVDVEADDWLRFRGRDGQGVVAEKVAFPATWTPEKNIKWTVPLPGPGSSSPIIVGDRIFLTCWTGYGVDARNPGEKENLKRHLVCLDRKTGKEAWRKTVDAVLPEDDYGGMFAENGYTTHTPVSDGESVFAFFGKSGVYAYSLDGKALWNTKVGDDLDPRRWGSASSPIIYKDKLIVTASIENNSLVGLNKKTGKKLWETPTTMLAATWSTPVIAKTKDGRDDLVLPVPYEVWGLNPDSGKLRWFCEGSDSNSMCASAIAVDGTVFVVGGRNGGALAVTAGGEKGADVTKTNRLWVNNERARIGTPVFSDGRLYWVYGGIAKCIEAKTGKSVFQARVNKPTLPSNGSQPQAGRGRRGGGQDYSSPILVDGKLYYVSRKGVVYVIEAGKEFKQLAANVLSDGGDFSASPAFSQGQMFIRSTKKLYCIGDEKKSADDDSKKAADGTR